MASLIPVVSIPNFSPFSPDFSPKVPDFSPNCISYQFFFQKYRIFLQKSDRVYSSVLDYSVVRTQARFLKIMIIGDWRRRSTRKATKSHLPAIPDFSLECTGFFSRPLCVWMSCYGCHTGFFSRKTEFPLKIKESPGLSWTAAACSSRLRGTSRISGRSRGALLRRGSLPQGGDGIGV